MDDDYKMLRARGPLDGVQVIDAGMNVAGPMASAILGDLGASVIKIEPPGGDTTRQYPPHAEDASAIFAMANHDKQLICLDLRSDGGRQALSALVAASDILIHNLRPGKPEDLGLDASSCHAINPRLVHGSITAFHPAESDRPGYDLLVQAESGIMDLTGPADGAPARLPGTMIDQVTGLWLAQGILAELHGARDQATVRVSLIDVATWLLSERATSFLVSGVTPQRFGSSTPVTTPHGAYQAADGDIVIGAASDRLFARLAAVLGPPVEGDDRFLNQAGRLQHRGELDDAITSVLQAATVEEWCARLEDAGVPVGRLRSLPEALDRHEANSSTGLRRSRRMPELGILAPPVEVSDSRWELRSATGPVGRDTDTVLTSLGFSAEALQELRQSGALGQPRP